MMNLSEAATLVQGTLAGADLRFDRLCTDTRQIVPGDLFVALQGEKFDGHEFVAQAIERGAIAAMVARNWSSASASAVPLLRVQDPRMALGALAAGWRDRFPIALVAVTGSNGKTTVKEMIASVLRAHCGSQTDAVLATEGNLNNDIGVPLMLLRLRASHRYAVIEMGMNHSGEISYLSRLAKPTAALVTNAQRAHIGLLGSVEGIARAKGEIFEGLRDGGCALINADDSYAYVWRELAGAHPRIEFALSQPAHVSARYSVTGLGSHVEFSTPKGDFNAYLQVPGVHNVRNALAACAAALALDIAPVCIAAGLRAFAGVKGRMQRKTGLGGALILDDTYNANPDSTAAAIDVLASMPGERLLVLGDMGELGENGAAYHADMGARAKSAGATALLTLGELSRVAALKFGAGARHYASAEELIEALKPMLRSGVTLLVKGSRFMRMERVVQACEAPGSRVNGADAHAA
jgi:UDP-N-acetylmuramoyl-tripeptide--D-alanyl-D-alanine ligase